MCEKLLVYVLTSAWRPCIPRGSGSTGTGKQASYMCANRKRGGYDEFVFLLK